jgi:hypothetical protein
MRNDAVVVAGIAAGAAVGPPAKGFPADFPVRRRRAVDCARVALATVVALWLPVLVGDASRAAEPVIEGSGVAKTETRPIGSFRQVSVAGPFEVSVVRDGSETLTIRADDNLLKHVYAEIEGPALRIYTRRRLAPRTPLAVAISAKDLDGFAATGSTNAALSAIASDDFAIEAGGAVNITAAGRCGAAAIALSGTATLDAANLICDSVEITINGVGEARVHASSAVAARINGVGKVVCYGNPRQVRREIMGIGSLQLVQ